MVRPDGRWGRGMSTRTFRVTVRGLFDGLSAEQHAELTARAAEHDILTASFTPEGHLGYDLAARLSFTFRFADSGEAGGHPGGDRPRRGRGARLDGRARLPVQEPQVPGGGPFVGAARQAAAS